MLEFLVLGEVPGTGILLDPLAVYNAVGILFTLFLVYAFYRHKVSTYAKEKLQAKQLLETAL